MSEHLETAIDAKEQQLNTQTPLQEPTEQQGKPKKKGSGEVLLGIALGVLITLLIISSVLLCIRLLEYAKVDEREVSLSSNMSKTLNVFALEYENEAGEIVIEGSDGEKVLAPGASVEYTVRIRNTDKIALDYALKPQVSFLSGVELPIEVRLINQDLEYIVGSATEWVPMSELNSIEYGETLLAGESTEYHFQWRWPYEWGDDAYDTWLGSSTLDGGVGANMAFAIHASANTDTDLNGGPFGYQTKDVIYILIFILLLIVAIVLLIIRLARKKTKPAPVVVAVPTPVTVLKNFTFDTFMTDHMNVIRVEEFASSYEAGEVVSLETLQQKGLMNPRATTLKILARANCELQKPLIVETHSISAEAKRAVLKAGGEVRIVKK